MTYYEIIKYYYGSNKKDNYGGGYTAEDVKSIMKGLKKEICESDPLTTFYYKKNSKFYYIVNEYSRDE